MAMLGNVTRIGRSIPNKMWQAAAMARVSINADSSSLREVFKPGIDAVGIKPGDSKDIARAIKELKDSGKALEMGQAAYRAYLKFGKPEIIGKKLLKDIRHRFPNLL